LNQDPRIGVFICECSGEIGKKVRCADLASYAASLEGVREVQMHQAYCMPPGLQEIKKAVAAHGLDRIVVAGCSPRTHEILFMKALSEASLNPYMLDVVNVRDHAAAVTPGEEAATRKASALVRIAVARATRLAPLENAVVKPERRVVVIGAGLAGLSAAKEVVARGLKALVVEKSDVAGGTLNRCYTMLPGPHKTEEFLAKLLADLNKNPNLEFVFSAEVTSLKGQTGAYELTVRDPSGEKTVSAGAVVVASGAEEFSPDGLFGFNGRDVITQTTLESLLKKGLDPLKKSIAMIQCAGGRSDRVPYCSRTCCMTAVKNALWIKEQRPSSEVSIIFRDIYTGGPLRERDLRTAVEKGIRFFRYETENPPIVERRDEGSALSPLKVVVRDILSKTNKELACDLIVLSNPLIPSGDSKKLAATLGLPVDRYGFLIDHYVRVKPSHFVEKGIFVCGNTHFPLSPYECQVQAYGSATRAANLLLQDELKGNAFYSEVDESKCIACGLCESTCSYQAIKVIQDEKGRKARSSEVNCLGCGTCAAGCPMQAIGMRHFTDAQISSQIAAAASY
jgi:heterodisulfide reductase subunit A